MDHRIFWFAARGQSIKGKQCNTLQFKTKYLCACVQNNLAYFPFMHCPLVANQKTRWSISPSNDASKSSSNFTAVLLRHNQFYSIDPLSSMLPLPLLRWWWWCGAIYIHLQHHHHLFHPEVIFYALDAPGWNEIEPIVRRRPKMWILIFDEAIPR